VHAAIEGRPGYSSRILALQEEGLGLAILEAEDFAVASDVQFALCIERWVSGWRET
jgi:hypothetical protein